LINGTNVDDVITVDLANDGLTISVTLNGVTNTRNVGSETSVRVSGFFGNDTINVVDMEGLDLDLRGGDGDDTFNVGSGSGTSIMFQAVTVTGDAGGDELVIEDANMGTSGPLDRQNYSFAGGAMQSVRDVIVGNDTTVPYAYTVETVTINGGFPSGTFDVASAGTATLLNLNGGGGADTLMLRAFAISATIAFDGQAEQSQQPPLPPIPNRVVIDDSAAVGGAGRVYTLDAGTLDTAGFGLLTFTGAREVELKTNNAGVTVDVIGVAAGAVTTVTGGAGDDTFDVGDGDFDTNILARVDVTGGGGNDAVTLDDSADAGADGYTLFGSAAFKSNVLPLLDYSAEEFFLIANSAANDITVSPSAQQPININGGNPIAIPGDRLIFSNAHGAGPATFAAGTYSFENAGDLNISGIETFPLPPGAAGTPDLRAEDDSGFSFTDNVTSVTTPTFTGTAPAGLQVAIFRGTVQIGTDIADGGGTWSIALANALADGTHVITAVARNATSGLSGPRSAPVNVTIDTVAPITPGAAPDLSTGSDTGLNVTDNVTRDNTPQFDGTVPANERVNLFADGVLVGTDATTAAGSYSVVASTLADGVRQMVVRFEDVAGNISPGFSPALGVTIDTVAPPAPTVAPDMTAASDTGVSSSDNVTRDNTPTFVGTRPNDVAVHLVQGNVLFGQVLTVGTTSYTVTSTTLADGPYNFAAIFQDVAGNLSPAGPTLPVTIDTVAPALASQAFNFLTSHDVRFAFNEDVGATLSLADFSLTRTPGGAVPNTSIALDYAANRATFTFPGFAGGILPDGDYRAKLEGAGAVTDLAGNGFAGTELIFFFMQADANRDRRVDLADFNILAANFGLSNRNFSQADFTYDGTVNLQDFNVLAGRFGAALGAGAPSFGGTGLGDELEI
jgi:hypothetical protein